jgi:hypothetical protein
VKAGGSPAGPAPGLKLSVKFLSRKASFCQVFCKDFLGGFLNDFKELWAENSFFASRGALARPKTAFPPPPPLSPPGKQTSMVFDFPEVFLRKI